MYLPTGDLFLVLTFVHKWDAWVIIPLLSNNECFYCLTHLSLYNTFPGFIFTPCYITVFEECLISITYHFSDKPRNFTRSGLQVSNDFLVQWRPKELGTVWRKTLLRTLLLMTIFWLALGSSRRGPIPPQQCFGHPCCAKFNFIWGGRGGFTSFTNITGKVLTLLTFFVVVEQ